MRESFGKIMYKFMVILGHFVPKVYHHRLSKNDSHSIYFAQQYGPHFKRSGVSSSSTQVHFRYDLWG